MKITYSKENINSFGVINFADHIISNSSLFETINQELGQRGVAAQIKKERATKLEGSFGKDKQHYYLKRIKARTKDTEILWIFMGIHVGNALEIGKRMRNRASLAA